LSEDHSPEADPTKASIAAAVRNAEEALANLKRALKKGSLSEISGEVRAAAATVAREAEHLISDSETLQGARNELAGSIQRNPLTAVGVAFGAGLLLALLTRG
jgi:ElaB/YqjD/DUF883 family membrane-anchored ribosome-binding protein